MNDYISRQAAIAALNGEIPLTKQKDIDAVVDYLTERIKRLNDIPSADVAEVVRCKDCKYWLPHSQYGYDYDNDEFYDYCALLVPDDDYYAFRRNADDYCSDGERITDEIDYRKE